MSRTSRIAGAVVGMVALAGSLAACGGDSLEKEKGGSGSSAGDGKKGSLVVGSASFTESKVLAELYAQILDDAGYSTSITTVKNRELY
ncbi:glycine betaine ABC transporter substrate-binding protein, partial [Streptomyces anulatus]